MAQTYWNKTLRPLLFDSGRCNGKQVTAVVGLKARFGEERNIKWADTFEHEGVHAVYSLMGMIIHAKLCLVLRSYNKGIRRCARIGTGNYTPRHGQGLHRSGVFH